MMRKISALLALLLTVVAFTANAGVIDAQDNLLAPERAFAFSGKAAGPDAIEASWKIAPGYYMYRDKFKFELVSPAGATLGAPDYPMAIRKHDEFFGDVETYRNRVRIRVPVTGAAGEAVRLRITGQGCADRGVCYPPMTHNVSFTLAPAKNAVESVTSLAQLGKRLDGGGDRQFLMPDEAFKLRVEPAGADAVAAHIAIAPGYYLYKNKIRFELAPNKAVSLGAYTLPPADVENDPYFGRTEIYHNAVDVRLPLTRRDGGAQAVELIAHYQGCAEKGICYPPQTRKVALTLTQAGAPTVAGGATGAEAAGGHAARSLVWQMLLAFGLGIGLSFTACVLPMIPILSSVIVGQHGRAQGKWRSGLLSYAYVLGTAVTYTAAGAVAGATGDQLQAHFQNTWAIGALTVVLLLMALAMFGVYDVQMPSAIQSRLQNRSNRFGGGGFAGAFLLGLFSALIVGACVSPILFSVLALAMATHDPVLGGAIMFALAHGQGLILIAIGLGAGFLLPKAGPWMTYVKQAFGVMLLGLAIYLLSALPQVPVLFLWAALLVMVGVYLRATQALPEGSSGWAYFFKGVGTLSLLWGVLALLGGMTGQRDILHPIDLSQSLAPASTQTAVVEQPLFKRVTTLAAVERELARAKAEGKPAILDFYASWCTDCVRMERGTFADPRVRAALQRFVLVQADVTENDANAKAIKQRFGVFGPPAMLFFGPDGTEKAALRFYGFKRPDEFLRVSDQV